MVMLSNICMDCVTISWYRCVVLFVVQHGTTALMLACRFGRKKDIVALLLDKGAEVNSQNKVGDR